MAKDKQETPSTTKLTNKQKIFVEEYLQSWNAADAARKAGYSKKSARLSGYENITKPHIKEYIEKRLGESAMSANEVLKRLSDQARGSLLPFIDITEDGFVYFDFSHPDAKNYFHLIKKIKSKRTRRLTGSSDNVDVWEDEWVEVELYDSQKALGIIGKHQQLFTPKEDKPSSDIVNFSIPAHLIAPSFFNAYRDIKDNGHLEYVFSGGRGSTKSSFISLAGIDVLINNPNMHWLATRQVGNTLRDSVFSQIRWAIMELGLEDKFKSTVNPLEIEYIPTGQKIYFRGGDDPIKIKSIKPVFGYIGILWLEELDQFRGQEAVRNIEQSAIRGGDVAYIFKSFNAPRTAANWANKYVKIPKANQYLHFSNYKDVPKEWLGIPWLEEAEHLKLVNPDAYEHEYGGIANGTGGLVFENTVIRAITDEEIAQFDRILDGVDWGYFPDPFSYGKVYYDAARMDLYIYGEYRGSKKSNKQSYKAIQENGYNPNDLIIADSAEPKSIADYREYGANIRGAEKGPDSVAYSMKWLQSLHSIIIDDQRAPYHAEEFINYELEKDKNDEFISAYPDKNNHAIDDTRYGTNLIWRRRGQ